MRIPWTGFVVVGIVLAVLGAYTILASQSQMNYDKSCAKPVACGTITNPRPELFMSKSTALSLQEAELTWVLGAAAVGLGLLSAVYGIYLHPERRAPSQPVKSPEPTASTQARYTG